jgi:hypothetical protein
MDSEVGAGVVEAGLSFFAELSSAPPVLLSSEARAASLFPLIVVE